MASHFGEEKKCTRECHTNEKPIGLVKRPISNPELLSCQEGSSKKKINVDMGNQIEVVSTTKSSTKEGELGQNVRRRSSTNAAGTASTGTDNNFTKKTGQVIENELYPSTGLVCSNNDDKADECYYKQIEKVANGVDRPPTSIEVNTTASHSVSEANNYNINNDDITEFSNNDNNSSNNAMIRNTTGISNRTSSTLSSHAGLDLDSGEAFDADQEPVISSGGSPNVRGSNELKVTSSETGRDLSLIDSSKGKISARLGLVVDDESPSLSIAHLDELQSESPKQMTNLENPPQTYNHLGVRGGRRLITAPIAFVAADDEELGGRRRRNSVLSASYPQPGRSGSGMTRNSSSGSQGMGARSDGGQTQASGNTNATTGNWGWFDEDLHNDQTSLPGSLIVAPSNSAGASSERSKGAASGQNLVIEKGSSYRSSHHSTGVRTTSGGDSDSNDYGNFDIDDEEDTTEEPPGVVSNQPRSSSQRPRGGLLQFSASTVEPLNQIANSQALIKNETGTMAVSAPNYVLEESISSQKLWRKTAGNRPPQPVEERAYFEEIWAQNFLQSQVTYHAPLEVLVAQSPISMSPYADVGFSDDHSPPGHDSHGYNAVGHFHNPTVFGGGAGDLRGNRGGAQNQNAANMYAAEATIAQRSLNSSQKTQDSAKKRVKSGEGTLTVLIKGDNIFGTTVSKSFARADRTGRIDTISISIASYRVVQSKKFGKYAQYLVVYREGSFQNTVGVWKRYSDFDSLARKVTGGQESCSSLIAQITPFAVHDDLSDDNDNEVEKQILPNAVTSWRLLKKRQRWFRCLDAGYLSLKVFLLERFLHDILFETTNPQILREFIGVDFLQ